MKPRGTKTKKRMMLTALKDNNGVVKWAAQQAGILSRRHYYWIKNDSVYRNQAMAYKLLGSKMQRDRTRTEKQLMLEALKKYHCNIRKATKEAGISVFKHYDWIRNDESYKSIVLEISDKKPHGIKTRKRMMITALKDNKFNVKDAAKQANIPVKTHFNWMKSDLAYRNKVQSITLIGNGYVYLVHCKETTFYKIGISKNNYGARLSQIQSSCPFEVEMIYVNHSDNYQKLEKNLHNMFKDKWVRGEWFDLDKASLDTAMKYLKDTHQPQMQIDFESQITSDNSDA